MNEDVPSDIACPAVRFLVKLGVANGVFSSCGPSADGGFSVDADSLKNLVKDADALGFNFVEVEDGVSVFARAFDGAIDSQTVDGSIDVTKLQEHFDHGASTGIIGAATIGSNDHASFNQDKYDDVLELLKNGDDGKTMFTEVDIGRVVNEFGSGAHQTNDVGGFSWAVLAFEYANLFFGFKEIDQMGNPYLSLENFEALFLDGGSTGATIDTDRPVEPWSLQETICKMEIQLTRGAIAQMTEQSNLNFFNLFITLCGDEFERCTEGYVFETSQLKLVNFYCTILTYVLIIFSFFTSLPFSYTGGCDMLNSAAKKETAAVAFE